ncbi:hypothetical protein OJ252_3571 [Cryptosporidium canis]|uniref:Uncharacterized protein n=1 Tax=Cryptosporidium canis TaxID=195482 RepID=A0ABQ8P1Y2_9CRYT|nr:hypothetical protein OJ252_3571 [Cryptosporidium canis]
MNKNSNVCLGRRGRPKKNQQKPSIGDYVDALLETDNFSFFPLENKKELVGKFSQARPVFKLRDNFASWYDLGESCCALRTASSRPMEQDPDPRDSVSVSLNGQGEEIRLGANSGINTKSNFMPFLIFTNGHVWRMAFSPPSSSPSLIFLALGIHSHDSPISQINRRHSGRGTVQIWGIPLKSPNDGDDSSVSPRLTFEVIHDGQFCRFLEWIPHSENGAKGSSGLLLCVLGDGVVYLLSIPSPNKEPPQRVDINDLAVWKYSSSHYTICSASIRVPDTEAACLRIAGTTVEGVLLVWTFERDSRNPSEQIIPISQNIPLLSASWCPIESSSLIAVADYNGKISIVDFRRSNNSILREFELPNRPITCIVWSRLVSNIYLSHGIGAIVLSAESGDYTQFTIEAYNKKKKYSLYEEERLSPVLGSRSWACCSFLHNAIFGFNDGSVIIGPCFEFESKSFQETILIKALVSGPSGDEDREEDGAPSGPIGNTPANEGRHGSTHEAMSDVEADLESANNLRELKESRLDLSGSSGTMTRKA